MLGSRLRAQRLKLGISQEDVAALAEMHVTNVGKIERGQANPNLQTIVNLAIAVNLDPGDLVAGLTSDMVPHRTHKLTAADLIREQRRRDGASG